MSSVFKNSMKGLLKTNTQNEYALNVHRKDVLITLAFRLYWVIEENTNTPVINQLEEEYE
jgi:hypothetical protein